MEERAQPSVTSNSTSKIQDLSGPGKSPLVEVWGDDPDGDWHYCGLLISKNASSETMKKEQTEQVARWFYNMEKQKYRLVEIDGNREYLNPVGPLSSEYYAPQFGMSPEEYDLYIVRARFTRYEPKIIPFRTLERNIELAKKHGVDLTKEGFKQFNVPAGFRRWHYLQQKQGRV